MFDDFPDVHLDADNVIHAIKGCPEERGYLCTIKKYYAEVHKTRRMCKCLTSDPKGVGRGERTLIVIALEYLQELEEASSIGNFEDSSTNQRITMWKGLTAANALVTAGDPQLSIFQGLPETIFGKWLRENAKPQIQEAVTYLTNWERNPQFKSFLTERLRPENPKQRYVGCIKKLAASRHSTQYLRLFSLHVSKNYSIVEGPRELFENIFGVFDGLLPVEDYRPELSEVTLGLIESGGVYTSLKEAQKAANMLN